MTAPEQKKRRFKREHIGRYETLFRIAGGGMAEVFAARMHGEAGFQKIVALKRMLPTLAEDDRFVTMFLDEGHIAANIQSPHVVSTLDLGRAEDETLYLVMELVVGVPLSRLIRGVRRAKEKTNVPIMVEILAQTALGLHDAHTAKTPMGQPLEVIHRDVSPQNILVDRDGRTRITDFGVARAIQRTGHTQGGEVKGKLAYFAPEQATSATLDHRVDVFALGICAWEALAGKRLFAADNPALIMAKILHDPIPRLFDVRPEVPAAVQAVVERALQRNVEDRWATALEFAQALRAALPNRATPHEIGSYVMNYGGESLHELDESLKTALTGSAELEQIAEPTNSDIPTVAGSAVTRDSAVTPGSGAERSVAAHTPVILSEPPVLPKRKLPWLPIAIILIAAALGGAVAVTMLEKEPTVTALPEEPVAATEPVTPPTPESVTAPTTVANPEADLPSDPVAPIEPPVAQIDEPTATPMRRIINSRRGRRTPSLVMESVMDAPTEMDAPSVIMATPMMDTPMTVTAMVTAMAPAMTETTVMMATPVAMPDTTPTMMLLRGWEEE